VVPGKSVDEIKRQAVSPAECRETMPPTVAGRDTHIADPEATHPTTNDPRAAGPAIAEPIIG